MPYAFLLVGGCSGRPLGLGSDHPRSPRRASALGSAVCLVSASYLDFTSSLRRRRCAFIKASLTP